MACPLCQITMLFRCNGEGHVRVYIADDVDDMFTRTHAFTRRHKQLHCDTQDSINTLYSNYTYACSQ